jgi:hypothetical protein
MIALLIIYATVFVIYLANHGFGLIIGLAVTAYLIDVTVRPRIKCRACEGTGLIFKRSRSGAQCPVCKGRKIHTRMGARVWRRHRYMFHDDPDAEPAEDRGPTAHERGWW